MGLEMKMRFTDVIVNGTLKNYYVNGHVGGYQFDVRLGYYRGHFLSVIDKLEVEVDGEKAEDINVTLCLNGKEFNVSELKDQFSEFWPIVKAATVKVYKAGGLSEGEHDVNFTLMLHSPYMPLPGATQPHQYTPINSCEHRKVLLAD